MLIKWRLTSPKLAESPNPPAPMEDVAEKTMTVPKQTSAVVQMITSQLRPGDER